MNEIFRECICLVSHTLQRYKKETIQTNNSARIEIVGHGLVPITDDQKILFDNLAIGFANMPQNLPMFKI